MHDIHFSFELRPLEDVEPWGTPERGLHLSWFGLTDGWYDVVVGEHRLYSTPDGDPRGIEYQVARLWEDLLAVAPFALEAILSVQRFRDELVRFDHDLIAAMQARVDEIAAGRLRADIAIAIDVKALHHEQVERATWLGCALSTRPGGLPPWDDVIAAVIETERHLGRSALDRM